VSPPADSAGGLTFWSNSIPAESDHRAIRLRDEAAAEHAMRAIIDEAATAVAGEFSLDG
jgi:hypothetical protein